MRRESTVQPRGGRQQFEGYDAYYGNAERTSQQATSTTPQEKIQNSQRTREEDMKYDHAHTKQHMRRQSTYQPLSGRSQHKLYEKNYGDPDFSIQQLPKQESNKQQQQHAQ